MADEESRREIVSVGGQDRAVVVREAKPATIVLGPKSELSLAHLPADERERLAAKHADLAIERDAERQRLADDARALQSKVSIMGQAASEMTEKGTAVTIHNTNKDSLGETKIVVGNTESAWKGIPDSRKVWVTLATIIGAALVLAAIFRR